MTNNNLHPCKKDGANPDVKSLGAGYHRAICPKCGESYSARGKTQTEAGWNLLYGKSQHEGSVKHVRVDQRKEY
jgi:hypothetical protein